MLEQQPQEIRAGQRARPDLASALGVSKSQVTLPISSSREPKLWQQSR